MPWERTLKKARVPCKLLNESLRNSVHILEIGEKNANRSVIPFGKQNKVI